MKRLVLTLAVLLAFALGCEAQNIWKPLNCNNYFLGADSESNLFAMAGYGGLIRSQDEGDTWTQVNDYYMCTFMAFSPNGRLFIFPSDQAFIFYSDDHGDTWHQTATHSWSNYSMKGAYAVNNDTLLLWGENHLCYTLDAGSTWQNADMSFLGDEYHTIGDVIANEAGDVYVSKWYYSGEDSGIFHSTLSDMQNWELAAFDGAVVLQMEFDPDGNVVAGSYWGGLSGFHHEPGFYLVGGQTIAVSDNGIIYKLRYTGDLEVVLNYSTDHGEHFFDVGEALEIYQAPPGGGDDGRIYKGNDNHLYFHGNGQYYKSLRDANSITYGFAHQGAEWYFNLSSFMGSPSSFYRMAVEGDTLIQGHQCSVITRQYLGGNGDKQFVYEDNGVVYWYNQTLQAFTTLYDFNAEEGESWICDIDSCSYEVTVQSIEEVTWEGRTYRVQNIAPIEGEFFYFYYGRIIEGIGSVEGLFPYPYACVGDIYDGPYPSYLRCYLVDGEMLYHDGEYDCEEYGYCWDGTVAEAYAGGDGTAENPYQIATSRQLALLAQQTNDGTGGNAYYILTDNLSLEACTGSTLMEWTPIGMPIITENGGILDTVPRFFTGHFDGQGHTVYGLRQNIDNGWFEPVGGLFGCIDGAEISNVHLSYCHIGGQGEYVGGLVGHAGSTDISNCSLDWASYVQTELWNGVAGGLVGYAGMPFGSHETSNETHHIRNCQMLGNAVNVEAVSCVGGIVGQVNSEFSYTPYEIFNCSTGRYYEGFDIRSEIVAGGIVGSITRGTISGCRNDYSVIGGGNNGVGGIAGVAHYVNIEGCVNQGDITGAYAVGGIVGCGSAYETYLNIFDCVNEGTITGHNTESGTMVGGIVGMWVSKTIRCVNKGDVTATAYHSGAAGGIVGDSFGVVANCYNRGNVTVAVDEAVEEVDWLFAGGIAGTPDSRIYNVYNTGVVSGPDLSAFPNTLQGYGNIIGYGVASCHYLNAYWLDDDDLSACGNVNEPELHGSSAFVPGATSTTWTLNDAQYGTNDLLEALNFGAVVVLDSVPYYPYLTTWLPDTENTNAGLPIMEPLYGPGGLISFFGSEWYYEIQNENGSITYQYMYQAGDTIVNDEPTQILVKINTLYDKGLRDEVTHEYVYERDGKLYWWNKTLEEFTVLYDLGAQPGDSWVIKVGTESLVMHVDAVENIEFEGGTYRMLRVSDENDIFSGNVVCGIGHLTSFFPERLMNNGDGLRVEGLRCYWVEDELVFNPDGEDCDAIYEELHGLEEDGPSTGSMTLMVYPNPTNGILFVETFRETSLPTRTYRITNLMGQTILSGNITAETQQIDVSALPQGMYFITLAGETRKFVVNR